MKITLIELFAGIGGFALGLEQAGFDIEQHYFSEIDRHAIANYQFNFKNAQYLGSVTNVRYIVRLISQRRKPGDRLVLSFGSPCQDFSMAGGRSGLDGAKSSLVKYALFLIRRLQPDVFVWENVKGAYSSNAGADYWAIIKAFANLPCYRHEQQLLDSSWFLPQHRERIYSLGHFAGRSRPGVFPIGNTAQLRPETERTASDQIAWALSANDHKSWVGNFVVTSAGIRRFTEIECERLQGFPDNWTKYGLYNSTVKVIPRTHRYRQCGNAVTVPVVKEIATRLLPIVKTFPA